jgi:DNA-binding NarL/FixJ family response regulator
MILDAEDDLEVSERRRTLQAVEETRRLRPDVVLMDIRMPELDGIEATRRVLADNGGGGNAIRVLMLTTFDLNEYVYDALRAGASGFLLKDVPPEQLADGIPRRGRGRRAAGAVDHPAADPGVRQAGPPSGPPPKGWTS